MKEFNINGVIQTETDMTEEQFQDLFLEWVESEGFIFGGEINQLITDTE